MSARRNEDQERVHVKFTVDVTIKSSASWTQGHTMGQIVDQARTEALGKLRAALKDTGIQINGVMAESVVADSIKKIV